MFRKLIRLLYWSRVNRLDVVNVVRGEMENAVDTHPKGFVLSPDDANITIPLVVLEDWRTRLLSSVLHDRIRFRKEKQELMRSSHGYNI